MGDEGGLVAASGDARSERRREDARFLTGAAQYAGDSRQPGQLHAVVVRSVHAHAEFSVRAAVAAAMPGVCGVFLAADLVADGVGVLPCLVDLGPGSGMVTPPRFPLAVGRVRHVGEPVALVVASSEAAAVDAAEAVEVEYAPLAPVVDVGAAQSMAAIWGEAPGNVAFRFRRGDAAAVAVGLAGAAHVVELELVNQRIAAAALEPRVAVGHWDEGAGRYELVLSGASVHVLARELSMVLGGARVDVACPDVGGGFGMKNVTYPEYALLLWAARRLGAAVGWVASRTDEFVQGVHGRANVTVARLGLDAAGAMLALQVETVADVGAYLSTGGPGSSTIAPATAMGGVYAIPAVCMDVVGVFTNTAPIDAYRGAGKPEANYVIERLIDVAARRLGFDAVELRRRNIMRNFPYRKPTAPVVVDGGAFGATLEKALVAGDWAGFAGRRAEAAARGQLRGIGTGCFLETSRGPVNEEAWLRFRADGGIDLVVGTQSNGQGHETSFARLAANRLGVDAALVRLVQGDTRVVPRGGGHGGARSLHMGGAAAVMAVDDAVRRGRVHAARLLQAEEREVVFAGGTYRAGGAAVGVLALAGALREAGMPGAMDGHGDNVCDAFTFPNGTHLAEVEIDPETGTVALKRYTAVDDYGVLLNPLLTEGQVQGGLAQGIGQALCEAIVYDEGGQLLSASFSDYAVPRGADLPDLTVRFLEVATGANPMGAKGSGQAGCIAAPQTVMNAVMDALAPMGVAHMDMPATAASVWAAMQKAGGLQAGSGLPMFRE